MSRSENHNIVRWHPFNNDVIIMAVLRKKQIREMEAGEREKKLGELRLELMKEKGHVAVSGAVTNPGKIRGVRKTIARLLTQKNMKSKQ